MAELLTQSRPVARKPHWCGCCERRIDVGVRYLNQRMAGEGSAWTFKCHEECNVIYWRLHREAELWDDEMVDPAEIRAVLDAEELKVA